MSDRIEVRHDWYGCETGCCGTRAVIVYGDGDDAREGRGAFEFSHMTKDEALEFGRKFAKEIKADVEVIVGDLRCFDEQMEQP